MHNEKSKVLLFGSGGVGTIAALNLEVGGLAEYVNTHNNISPQETDVAQG